ncbi:MAG TPA: Mov34/MPN/PAD-1 family protein, partial [Isosphaeraceae bacterium]|nr:Mov34/MPN/PAD-1 family protein [Isosphaeraceae bacterium]
MSDASNPKLPDVRILKTQELPDQVFPGGQNQDFRVYFAPLVHKALWQHATEDVSVEICGVVVGSWGRDASGPFVTISESIRGDAAENKLAEVTFTHETWAKINAQMDTKFSHLKIVGWYHTHPDFGVFLSDRDQFIHEHFFSGPGQIAHVIDPVRKIEGVFVWKEGKTSLAPHYWVGDQLITAPSADPSEQRTARKKQGSAGSGGTAEAAAENEPKRGGDLSILSFISQLLMYACVFMIGFLLSNYWSGWQQTRLVEGVVAHYGLWEGLRPGLRDKLNLLDRDLETVRADIEPLASDHLKLAGTKATEQSDKWREVFLSLELAARRTSLMRDRYCPSSDEELRYLRTMAEKIDVLTDPERQILYRNIADLGIDLPSRKASPAGEESHPPPAAPGSSSKTTDDTQKQPATA